MSSQKKVLKNFLHIDLGIMQSNLFLIGNPKDGSLKYTHSWHLNKRSSKKKSTLFSNLEELDPPNLLLPPLVSSSLKRTENFEWLSITKNSILSQSRTHIPSHSSQNSLTSGKDAQDSQSLMLELVLITFVSKETNGKQHSIPPSDVLNGQ